MSAPAPVKRDARIQLKEQLARFTPSYEAMLPRGYRPDRLITGAMLATVRNPALLECSPVSVAVALGQVAQLGLDVGITAHLVPYGKTCTFVADYKGYIEIMCRAAGARKVEAWVVREGDAFEYGLGLEPYLRHQPRGNPKAKMTHAYAIATLRTGEKVFEVVTVEQVEAIRQKHSKQWAKGDLPEWYARKTAVRQLWKYVPKTPQLEALVQHDDDPDGMGRTQVQHQLLPGSIPPGLTVDVETGEVLEDQPAPPDGAA